MPMTVTCDAALARGSGCRRRRGRRRRVMPSARAVSSTASRSFFQSRGAVTSTPRISRRAQHDLLDVDAPRPRPARACAKIEEVTPGRSLPVSVMSRVSGLARRSVSHRAPRLSPGEPVPGSVRRPHLGRAGGDQRPPAGAGQRPQGARGAARSRTPTRAPPSSSSARSTISSACSAAARPGRRSAAGTPSGRVDRRRGAAGSSAGRRPRAATGRRRGGPARRRSRAARARSVRSASPTSGSCRRSAGVRRPGDRGPDALRHQPDARHPTRRTTASPASSAAALNAARPAEPDRVALDRAAPRPKPVAPARAQPARAPTTRVSVPSAPGQPGDGVGGVVAEHRVDQQVGDDVAAQPGGAPPREPARRGQAGGHGRRRYARGRR